MKAATKSSDWLFRDRLTNLADRVGSTIPVGARVSPFRALEGRFLIACTARSGSTLLCQRLLSYGVVVQEFFNQQQLARAHREDKCPDLNSYCRGLVDTYAPFRTFGVKGAFQIVAPLFLLDEFPDHLPEWKVVFLRRENLVRQAISTLIAEKSGSWRSAQPAQHSICDEDYDGARIASAIETILAIHSSWEKFFAVFNIEPLRISFEELTANTDSQVARVADFLGLERLTDETPMKRFGEPPVEPQATELNSRWEKRFYGEARGFKIPRDPV